MDDSFAQVLLAPTPRDEFDDVMAGTTPTNTAMGLLALSPDPMSEHLIHAHMAQLGRGGNSISTSTLDSATATAPHFLSPVPLSISNTLPTSSSSPDSPSSSHSSSYSSHYSSGSSSFSPSPFSTSASWSAAAAAASASTSALSSPSPHAFSSSSSSSSAHANSNNNTTATTTATDNLQSAHALPTFASLQRLLSDHAPHTMSADSLCTLLGVDGARGLGSHEAVARAHAWGFNRIPIVHKSFWRVFKSELDEPLIMLLGVVGILYAVFGRFEEALSAIVIIVVCVLVEIATEYRAKRAVSELSRSQHAPPLSVLRDGRMQRLDRENIVVGDIVQVEPGDRVPGDGRLLHATWLLVDESQLTGESRCISKRAEVVIMPPPTHDHDHAHDHSHDHDHGSAAQAHSSYQHHSNDNGGSAPSSTASHANMLLADTLIVQGHAMMCVTATGEHTVSGRVRVLARKAYAPKTPLQAIMKRLAKQLTIAAAAICAAYIVLALVRGMPFGQAILSGLALAFATIPEELPILIKAVLAISAVHLTHHHIVVKSLRTAENLGAVTTVLTDKTGTLTENRLRVLALGMQGQQKVVASPSTSALLSASTAEMMRFGPLFETWVCSSPALSVNLAMSHALEHAMSTAAIRDRFDHGIVDFFLKPRSHPSDVNTPFLQSLLVEAVQAGNVRPVVKLLPFDGWRRRSSCVRRVDVAQDASSSSSSSTTAVASATGSSVLRLYCRGSAEQLLGVCAHVLHADGRVIDLTDALKRELVDQMRVLGERGARLLGFAVRGVSERDLEEAERKEHEHGLSDAYAGAAAAEDASAASAGGNGADGSGSGATPSSTPSSSGKAGGKAGYRPFPTAVAQAAQVARVSAATVALRPAASSILERKLTFVGYIALTDSVKPGVALAVRQLQQAGIVVKMVTGDVETTATHVATESRIISPDVASSVTALTDVVRVGASRSTALSAAASTSATYGATDQSHQHHPTSTPSSRDRLAAVDADTLVYCRMTPDDKYRLVTAHQSRGDAVLFTGDGFNDGPALATADVGLAMGQNGTDMARDSAGIILTNDHFPAVVAAIQEGRRMLDNLKKSLRFYLACKFALVLLFVGNTLLDLPLPMLPLHVILLEMFMDLGASAAFTTEPAEYDLMRRTPQQWHSSVLLTGASFWPLIVASGVGLYCVVGGVFLLGLSMHTVAMAGNGAGADGTDADALNVVQTMTLVAWLVAHVLLAQSMRSASNSALYTTLTAPFRWCWQRTFASSSSAASASSSSASSGAGRRGRTGAPDERTPLISQASVNVRAQVQVEVDAGDDDGELEEDAVLAEFEHGRVAVTLFSNPLMLAWTVLAIGFAAIVVLVPALREFFALSALPARVHVWPVLVGPTIPAALIAFGVPLAAFVVVETFKASVLAVVAKRLE